MRAAVQDREPQEMTASVDAVAIGCGRSYLLIKRIFDVVLSVFAGIVLAVPMIIIGILIRLDSKGPAVFKQKRMGKDGKTFTIYKFRTMHVSAPTEKATCDFIDADQYVTRMGLFLRRTSIDELPQLFNVLRGEMSIVGYRPVCLTETKLNELRERYGVFAFRPGITGLAQVSGRDSLNYEEKARLDAQYIQNCSLRMDLWCLLKTVKTVFTGEGAK